MLQDYEWRRAPPNRNYIPPIKGNQLYCAVYLPRSPVYCFKCLGKALYTSVIGSFDARVELYGNQFAGKRRAGLSKCLRCESQTCIIWEKVFTKPEVSIGYVDGPLDRPISNILSAKKLKYFKQRLKYMNFINSTKVVYRRLSFRENEMKLC